MIASIVDAPEQCYSGKTTVLQRQNNSVTAAKQQCYSGKTTVLQRQNKMSRVDDISVTYAHMAGFDINSGMHGSNEYSECSRCMVASIINDRDNRQLRSFQDVFDCWRHSSSPAFAHPL